MPIFSGEDLIYVAVRPATDFAFEVFAVGDDSAMYQKTLTARIYTAGNFYNMVVRLNEIPF